MAGFPSAPRQAGRATPAPGFPIVPDPEARRFEPDPALFFPDTIPVPRIPDVVAKSAPAPRPRHRHRFKLLGASIIVSVTLLILARPRIDHDVPSEPLKPVARLSQPHDGRFEAHVKKVQALQAHRSLAAKCVAAVRRQAPEITTRGKPTLIHIEGSGCDAQCLVAQRHSEQLYARWTGLHLNGIWVGAQAPRDAEPLALRRLEAPPCAALVPAQEPSTRLVLDRDGRLFFAGEQENRLKAGLWLRKPGVRSAQGPARAQSLSLLLQSGKAYRVEEAVVTVTTARSCKWHLGECSLAVAEHRAVQRLDATPAEQLVREGEAEAGQRNFVLP